MSRYLYLDPKSINKIEVELTSKCNAACPSCNRTDIDGKAIRSLPLEDISLAQFQRILPPSWVTGRTIKLCGVYGDPLMARDALMIVRYLVENQATVVINTNASLRDEKFWKELALLMKSDQRNKCIFSIDGLEDTNSIYRRNTQWPKIMKNAETFIAEGGPADWDFLAFDHNEHQVDEVQALARKMNFRKFTLKKTTRASDKKKPSAIEQALKIQPSHQSEYRHSQLQTPPGGGQKRGVLSPLGFLSRKISSMTSQDCEIHCFTRGEAAHQKIKERSLYISAQQRLWPCCWWAGGEFPRSKDVRQLFKTYGEEFNHLQNKSIDEVLQHPWYQKQLVKSWHHTKSTAMVCQKNCQRDNPLNNEDCEDVIF